MIPFVAPPPPPQPAGTVLAQQAAATSPAAIPDPKGRGGRRRSPLNRRGRRHLEAEMRRRERGEFRRQVQLEIDLRAIATSPTLAKIVTATRTPAPEQNNRAKRFARAIQNMLTRATAPVSS